MSNAKTLPPLRIAFLGLLLALFGGQSTATRPTTTPATTPTVEADWGTEVDGFKLAASVDKTKFDGPVEGIVVHVRLRYTLPGQVHLPSGPLHLYSCRVTRDGKPSAMTAYGKMNDPRSPTGAGTRPGQAILTLGDGVDDVYDFPCSRVVDMTEQGTYIIVIERILQHGPDQAKHTVESLPLWIEVSPSEW